MKIMNCLRVLALVLALCIQSAAHSIELNDLNGGFVDLENYIRDSTLTKNTEQASRAIEESHWLLIKLWSVDCGVCRQQVPVISKMHHFVGQAETPNEKPYIISVLGISTDTLDRKDEVEFYIKDKKPSYPNLISSYHPVAAWLKEIAQEEYRGTPTYLLFDPKGELAGVQTSVLKEDSLHNFIARY